MEDVKQLLRQLLTAKKVEDNDYYFFDVNGEIFTPRQSYYGEGWFNKREPRYIVVITRSGFSGRPKLDELGRELGKIAYTTFEKYLADIEGDVYIPDKEEKTKEGEEGMITYFIFKLGDLIASFSAKLVVYKSRFMPKNWIWSRIKRLQKFGVEASTLPVKRYRYIVVRIVKKLEVTEFEVEKTIELPVEEKTEEEKETETRIRSLIKQL